ncbi:MAG: type II secretion system protein [Planctomycetota bacterium]
MSTHRKRGGFSLAELMVVVGIVGVLAAVVAGSVNRVMAISRRTKCSANLHYIGQAYAAYQTRLDGNRSIGAYSWGQMLMPYLGENPNAAVCPEDEFAHSSLPDLTVSVTYFGLGADHEPNTRQLFSRFPHWEAGPCEHPGPGVWKLNNEDYSTFAANPDGQDAVALLPQYTPGSNPASYWIVIEEGLHEEEAGSDYDYDDLVIHVTEHGDNTVSMTFHKQWYYANYEVFTADGEELGDPDAESIGTAGNSGPFVLPGVYALSYGLNWRVTHIPPAKRRIVALDYDREVAHVGGASSVQDEWATQAPPRHLGKLNVLFGDGTVSGHAPDEIDPGQPGSANDLKYWDPLGP